MTDEVWDLGWDTNVKGTFLCIQAELDGFIKKVTREWMDETSTAS